MPVLSKFSTPANIKDFSDLPALQAKMDVLWSAALNRFAQQAIIPDPWDMINFGPCPAFYNPLVTDTPAGAVNAPITWGAFPGRIPALYPNNGGDWVQWADQGVPSADPMTIDLCSQQTITPTPYTPTGPRGWQDEYCEWSVTRNPQGKITSIMFSCENPEYWLTLWQTDPNKVLELYCQLVNPAIKLDDLCLRDASGAIVTDPNTGQPCYNPLNPWNSGTQSLPNKGGAVHLTSSPNTLGAEFILASVATMPRSQNGEPVTDAAQLVCFAKYGRIGRHSDPTIGQNVNQYANYAGIAQAQATLTNPVGLYMQMPDFSNYKTPDGTPASSFWKVVRGHTKDPKVTNDIDRILHATFSVPVSKGYTVSDIQIGDAAIQYASQIAQTFNMALMATVFGNSGVTQTPVGETTQNPNPSPAASVLQAANVFVAYRQQELNANEIPLSVPVMALPMSPGQTLGNVALMLNTSTTPPGASFTVPEGGVTIQVTGTQEVQSVGGPMQYYIVNITVDAAAALGDRTVLASVPGMPATHNAAIGLLTVGSASTTVNVKTSSARRSLRAGRA